MRDRLVRLSLVGAVLDVMLTLGSGVSQAKSAGETLFKTKCAACHGQDGKGEVPDQQRP
jgi:mono/diheme cytochrome c family protein